MRELSTKCYRNLLSFTDVSNKVLMGFFFQQTPVGQMALNALKSQSPGNLHYRVIIQMEREHLARTSLVAGISLHHQNRL